MRQLVTIVLLLLGSAAANAAELPRILIDTRYITPPGSTTHVASGGNLQTAINNAACGDVITLEAGATWTGNYTLPDKNCTDSTWVYIRTDTPDGTFPRVGNRVSPSHASLMAKLTSATTVVVGVSHGADHYRLIGLDITVSAAVSGVVWIGDKDTPETTDGDLPHHIIIDRCYIHGSATLGSTRGVSGNGKYVAVIDSYLSDFKKVGQDTQAFAAWNGAGPFKLVNNYLEGAGENVMFGGADPAITNLVPSDIEIRRNKFSKPLTWDFYDASYAGTLWQVKNILELKNARRVLIEGNLFENCWEQSQTGMAINISVHNQDNTAPWSATQEITFRGNWVRHAKAAINLSQFDSSVPGGSEYTEHVDITHNLFTDIGGFTTWGPDTDVYVFPLLGTPQTGPTIEFNTFDSTIGASAGAAAVDGTSGSTNFIMRHNIFQIGQYGLKGTGTVQGNATLAAFFATPIMTSNVLVWSGFDCAYYPVGNTCVTAMTDVGFVNLGAGDYRLDPSSSYDTIGTAGADYGAWVPAATAAGSQLDWGIETRNGYTGLEVRFGVPGLPYNQSCDVRVGASVTTSATGPSRRSVVVTGLTPASSYFVGVDCGTTWGGALRYTNFTAASVPGGTQTVTYAVGTPPSILAGAARVTVDCDDNAALSSPTSVQNTSCGSGCNVNQTLPSGLSYCRHRWQSAADAVLATSSIQPLSVQ